MDDRVAALRGLKHELCVPHIAVHGSEIRMFWQKVAEPEGVEDDDFVAVCQKMGDKCMADIAGAAGNEYAFHRGV